MAESTVDAYPLTGSSGYCLPETSLEEENKTLHIFVADADLAAC